MMWSKLGLVALAGCLYDGVLGKDWQSPEFSLLFREPLPIPPVKQPKQYVNTLLICVLL